MTGSTSGIGLAIARRLARAGYELTLVARSSERLEHTAKTLCDASESRASLMRVFPCDLADQRQLLALAADLEQRPRLDLLVNCAGVARTTYLHDIEPEKIGELAAVNLVAPMLLSRAALQPMTHTPGAVIVNVASMIALLPYHGYTVYAATKAGLLAFSDALRREAKVKGVRVLSVLPADVDTPMLAAEHKTMPLETRRLNGSMVPISPEQVAQSVMRALERGYREVVPGTTARLMREVIRLIPAPLADFIIARISNSDAPQPVLARATTDAKEEKVR